MNEQSLGMIELELAILIRRTTAISSRRNIGNLDRSAYLLLHQIISNGSAGVKVLADEFQLDISTVSRQAGALEQKGYVYRIPDPRDGRGYSYQITDLGKMELEQYRQIRVARIDELLSDWTDKEREEFGRLLKKFNTSFK